MARVLLVDDDPAILRLLEVNFRMEGFGVDAANHGEEALAMATATPPDVVVLDLMMPGMDGRELCRRLRATPETASVPIVFLTARGRDETPEADRTVVVAKPFDTVELITTVRSLLETNAP
jgi:DNA-binding response OmpR family regulator